MRHLLLVGLAVCLVSLACTSGDSDSHPARIGQAEKCQPESPTTDQLSEPEVNTSLIMAEVGPYNDDFPTAPLQLIRDDSLLWFSRERYALANERAALLGQLRDLGVKGIWVQNALFYEYPQFGFEIETFFVNSVVCSEAFLDSDLVFEKVASASPVNFGSGGLFASDGKTVVAAVPIPGAVIRVTMHDISFGPPIQADVRELANKLADRYTAAEVSAVH